ncbi:MAG: type II secretion system F family protein [Syntrophomonadaceae bacterium]|nr:type II secretion system F family protein [Syntrophomonadaceae bacterium]
MKFRYRVCDDRGRPKSGTWEAERKDTVVAGLLDQNYYIVSLQELPSAQLPGNLDLNLGSFKKVGSQELVAFTRQLSIMLAAGLPIMRCLRVLEEQAANPRLKQAILQIQDDIETGSSLGEAFSRQAAIFSGVYISMLKAGETAGTLDMVLNKLSYHLAKEHEFSGKLKSASIYPIFISVIAVMVVLLIITVIMPRFVSIFESSGMQLPLPTRVLMDLSAFLHSQGLLLLIGFILITGFMKWFKRTAEGELVCDTILLHLPIVGRCANRLALARFARTLGILTRSGINIVQALEVVKDVVGNAAISKVVAEAKGSIMEGDNIAGPLQASGWFDPLATQMIAVGEETGRLDDILIHLSDYYEGELISSLDRLTTLIEPTLIFLVAIVIGGVVISVLYPMFDMINLVGI